MTSIEQMTPAEIDGELARIWSEEQRNETSIAHNVHRLNEAVKAVEAGKGWEQRNIEQTGDLLASLRTQASNLRHEAEPYEAEYTRRGRWNRYFLVTNSNGHVHRGMNCSTCFPTTEYAWITDLADCDEATMVVEYGEKACTVCFPDAPAHPAFAAPGRRDQAAIAARQAEKAERDAAKASKAITDVDGSPLRDSHHGILRTKVAARNALSSDVQSYGWYGPTHPMDFLAGAVRLAAALRAAGIDPVEVAERAAKKVAKEGAEHAFPIERLTVA